MSELDFKPIGNLILVSPIVKDNKTKAGIIKVAADVAEPSMAKVVSLGHLAEAAGIIKVDDTVMYSYGSGIGIVLNERDYTLLDASENGTILGVIKGSD